MTDKVSALIALEKFNTKVKEEVRLKHEVFTNERLLKLGFKEEHDGTGDPRGTDWNIRNDNYHLWVDAYCDVYLSRLNPDTDAIRIKVDDTYDLEHIVDWIKD